MRNPRYRKLIEINGSKTDTRKKNPRAGRSSALNCPIHFRISILDSEQAEIYQPPEEFREILAKQLRLDVEFTQQVRISIFASGSAITQLSV